MSSLNRRTFVLGTAAAGLALGAGARADNASNKLLVGVMGTGGRGTALATLFAKQEGIEVVYTCDADMQRAENAASEVAKVAKNTPKATQNYKEILDDNKVDILVCATCNHWHAPATILATAAGKHVYVEKPCSHNPREGELMVEAARKHKKKVQMGNQRRSWEKIQEACDRVRKGDAIGRAYFAQSWYTNNRPSTGKGEDKGMPARLDYDIWQGPAPRKPFKSNYLPYTWHWFWHWGNGELGNNGVHMIDLCRWGLGVDYPIHVTSSGGRFRYDDDQETPDTHVVSFQFPGKKSITWEGLSCSQLEKGMPADVLFVGEKGTLVIRGNGYTIYDPKGKEVEKVAGKSSDADHVGNFLNAIRGGKELNSEIEEAYKSTLLCHLGNIAHRTGRALKCEPTNGKILDDKAAMELWTREYAKGYEPKV
jgi:predicted dehydrogenase